MDIKAISFTGKTPRSAQIKQAYNKAIAELLGQSDKDYFILKHTQKSQPKPVQEDFLKQAKKFFAGTLGQ